MTTEDYLKRMAELGIDRAALETGIQEEASRAMVRKTRLSQLLPEHVRKKRWKRRTKCV